MGFQLYIYIFIYRDYMHFVWRICIWCIYHIIICIYDNYTWLVVWNIFYFPIILGIIIPIEYHIFQRGLSNHQPDTVHVWYVYILCVSVCSPCILPYFLRLKAAMFSRPGADQRWSPGVAKEVRCPWGRPRARSIFHGKFMGHSTGGFRKMGTP